MPFFDAAFSEIASETKILPARTASDAIIMWARAPHHRHDQIAEFDARHFGTDFDHLAERLMTNNEMVRVGGRRTVFKGADLTVRAADAGFDHAKLYVRRGRNLGFGVVDDVDLFGDRGDGNGLHV